jgi:hypothetical protein
MEGGPRPLGSLHGAGGGQHDGHGAAACEEEVVFGQHGQKRKKRTGWPRGLKGRTGL